MTLPRLVFGEGASTGLAGELALLGVHRPLLISDRGLERAGVVGLIAQSLPDDVPKHLDVSENPTVADADAAFSVYAASGCDGVVALGGGSVLDAAKFVAALASRRVARGADLLGKPELITGEMAPLIAIPTTAGTGSESSPVAALHGEANGPAIGTRSFRLIPKVAICDPFLIRTLPRKLIAATGVDALSHCIEGYFADPPSPIIDALAVEGVARVLADLRAAVEPEGDRARGSLMVAAFAGGAAIQKGLGPAHAIALACADQDLHHGTLIGVALPLTVRLVAARSSAKASQLAAALRLSTGADLADAIRSLTVSLGLPTSLREAGYRVQSIDSLVDVMVQSPFNRTSPYAPTRQEYREMTLELTA
jgi:4-hydroxybutyrate dehydrogenase